ncbi:hypothetical protein EPUS_08226 [Endocarpon pusillum Z07020]|uniref:Aminoglycoside phosphotransferase domain-containing protein n=1 Tax=Endocarpon pusillum (strain Z07020 / HMAS-L-300199) TaxID=1263415 RepID=U1HNH3_ENDPU|nr:uncharacterized protein EPUS_08226 [Endocarpon pusillum Z07020]ERF71910.1 hypothetical protein EPUS_08226 [Endocarpon pusillum Z07020]
MSPPMRNSVVKLNEQRFRLGSSMICEQTDVADPSSLLASWQDNGKTFILRKEAVHEYNMLPSTSPANMVHEAGTSAAVWLLGKDTFCKVKGWCEGMEAESETIDFVRTQCPDIPVPEVIFSWIDTDWSRSFTLIKRVAGKTLDERWPSLSPSQRSEIVDKVVEYCKKLSMVTSSKLESATGKGLCDNHLNVAAPDSHPTWKPRLLGPMSGDDFKEFLRQRTSRDAQGIVPSVGEHFLFYHADLGPTNIIISEDAKVTGILDWECAAFFPRFWLALKPGISAGFFLSRESVGEDKAARFGWGDPFYKGLMAQGFDSTDSDLAWWKGLAK